MSPKSHLSLRGGLALGLLATVLTTVALATITFDAGTGTGFVGKGDVQYTLGWNNAELQNSAGDVRIRASSQSVTEYTWTCDRDAGPQTQERNRTVTTTTAGLVVTVTRDKKQVTGFLLQGYDGTPTETTESDGPPLWSCATGWTAIDPITTGPTPLGGGLEVSGNAGASWKALLEKP